MQGFIYSEHHYGMGTLKKLKDIIDVRFLSHSPAALNSLLFRKQEPQRCQHYKHISQASSTLDRQESSRKYCDAHFTEGETEAQRGEVIAS